MPPPPAGKGPDETGALARRAAAPDLSAFQIFKIAF
jgi:hypothetical protein